MNGVIQNNFQKCYFSITPNYLKNLILYHTIILQEQRKQQHLMNFTTKKAV